MSKKPYSAICKVTFEMELDNVQAENEDKAMIEVQESLLDWYKLYQADHVKYEIDIIEYENVDYSDPKTKSFYCQREIELESKCIEQCEHCKEYYKPLEQ